MTVKHEDVFREDGTVKGTTFRQTQPQRGSTYPMLSFAWGQGVINKRAKSFAVNNNFHEQYAELMKEAAKAMGVSPKSAMFKKMLESAHAYLARYGMRVEVEVRQVEFQNLIYDKKERSDAT